MARKRVQDQWVWVPLGEFSGGGALSQAAFSHQGIAQVAAQEAQSRLGVAVTPVLIDGLWRLHAAALPSGPTPWDIFVRM